MGLYVAEYAYSSSLPRVNQEAREIFGERVKRQVIADACNRGYTPNGNPVLVWSPNEPKIKATLPVAERTP
jgi:hypothetical protein